MSVRRLALLALLGLHGVARAQPAEPDRGCAVALDASLSMAGFYAGGRDTISGLLNALDGACGDKFLVGVDTADALQPRLGNERPSLPFGADSRLDRGLARWLKTPGLNRLLLVTDNVADSGTGAQRSAQREFYETLHRAKLTHVSIIILRLPFSGYVYDPATGKRSTYTGDRALTIYVLERNGPIEAGNDAFLRRVETLVGAQGFRPYRSVARPDRTDYAVARLSPFKPGIEAGSSGVSFVVEDGGRFVRATPGGAIEVERGASDRETRFAVNKLRVSTGKDWDFGRAPFSSHIEFPADRELGGALRAPCTVDPKQAAAGLDSQVTLSIACAIPPVWNDLTAEQRHTLALKGKSWREGTLLLAIETRDARLTLRGPLQLYFGMEEAATAGPDGLATPTAAVQARVYRLSDLLVNVISPADRTVVIKRFPLRVHQSHSGLGVVTGWLGRYLILILVIAALIVAGVLIARPLSYRVRGGKEEGLRLSLGETRTMRSRDDVAVTVTSLGVCLIATVAGKRAVLGRGGGAIKNQRGAAIVTLEPAASPRARPRPPRGGRSRR